MTTGFKLPRETYVPKGAVRITDKGSDAVAFVYVTGKGRPAAMAFHGRAAKPDWHHAFPNEAAREGAIRRHFETCRRTVARKAERRAEIDKPHGLEVGHVFVASWGYEQTNVDFFQVTAILGTRMVEVRPIGKSDASTGNEPWATGKTVPTLDAFMGKPMRRQVNGASRSVRIDGVRTAYVWDGRPWDWTAYA